MKIDSRRVFKVFFYNLLLMKGSCKAYNGAINTIQSWRSLTKWNEYTQGVCNIENIVEILENIFKWNTIS